MSFDKEKGFRGLKKAIVELEGARLEVKRAKAEKDQRAVAELIKEVDILWLLSK